jgi:hypothetical protein
MRYIAKMINFVQTNRYFKHEFGMAFFVDSKYNHLVINFTQVSKCLCVLLLRLKGRSFNYSLINIHAPTNVAEEEAKDQFYERTARASIFCLPDPELLGYRS